MMIAFDFSCPSYLPVANTPCGSNVGIRIWIIPVAINSSFTGSMNISLEADQINHLQNPVSGFDCITQG